LPFFEKQIRQKALSSLTLPLVLLSHVEYLALSLLQTQNRVVLHVHGKWCQQTHIHVEETHTEEDYKYDQWRHFFYVEAPQEWNASSVATTVSNHDDSAHKEDADSVASTSTSHRLSVFLAGGISNCPDWQSEVMRHVGTKCEKLFVLNPRRTSWDTTDVAAAGKQIQWEFDHLRRASAILFWFPEETLCPITLFELGQWSALAAVSGKKIFVGTHPGYKRRLDVEIQLRLVLPSVAVVDNLEALSGQVIAWYREQTPKNGSTGGECSVQ
jgi:hypothetical protein